VSCPKCHAHTLETQKNSARERQRQWVRAKALGEQDPIGQRQAPPKMTSKVEPTGP